MRSIDDGIIVIPDIHGRGFWRDAVDVAGERHVVFLGDYSDPFPDEGITPEQALEELEAIISLKRSRSEGVTLLLGNHDLQYIWPEFPKTRFDSEHAQRYASLFLENRDCFEFTAPFLAQNLTVILTHAGIIPGWMEANSVLFGLDCRGGGMVNADFNKPNAIWRDREDSLLFESLSQVSVFRGGTASFGSLVWADIKEMMAAPEAPGFFQIFGHTRHPEGPFITESFACIDTRKAYLLDKYCCLSAL